MRRERGSPRSTLRNMAAIAVAAAAVSAGHLPAGGAETTPLSMEELEVRGVIEKPDRLYVSMPKPIFDPAPVRLDLFSEDLGRPVHPPEIGNGILSDGGALEDGSAGD